jgi:hypothetical protein
MVKLYLLWSCKLAYYQIPNNLKLFISKPDLNLKIYFSLAQDLKGK